MTLKLNGSSSGYTAIDAPAAAGSNTLTLPADNGSNGEFLKTNGSGVLSFATVSGGTSWQAVKTSTFTAVAGEGYFINTTGGAFEMDLPAGSIGYEVAFIDYAGTFDTYALTIDQNGTEKIKTNSQQSFEQINRMNIQISISTVTLNKSKK